jgi:hypothetical protein
VGEDKNGDNILMKTLDDFEYFQFPYPINPSRDNPTNWNSFRKDTNLAAMRAINYLVKYHTKVIQMTEQVSLQDALTAIAPLVNANPDDLIQFASEDTIGGWSPNPNFAKWPIGSIFGEEGAVIYSLVRALKPQNVINLGVYHGASVAHIAAALKMNANEKARVWAVDHKPVPTEGIPEDLLPYIKFVESDGAEFLRGRWPAKVGLVFEDCEHLEDETRDMWELIKAKLNLGAVAVAHDYLHWVVGLDVQNALLGAEVEPDYAALIGEADTGIAVWIQRSDV